MKKLVLISARDEFTMTRLYKDEGLLPYYIGKEYKLETEFLCSNFQKKLPNVFRTMKIIEKPIRLLFLKHLKCYKYFYFEYFKYLLKNSHKIDYLLFFQLSLYKLPYLFLYKFLNKSGKVYIKLDIGLSGINHLVNVSFYKKNLLHFLIKKIDLFSCETKECFEEIREKGLCNFDISDKLAYIPNGFDEDYLTENNIKVKKFEDKENIMITVGRIGTEEKNNEMLLNAINKMDLKNWKVYIIGPYTAEFKEYYDDFIKNDQDKKNKVILAGNIEDKNLLYDYYNRAKVFLFTSRWESFGIVLNEALRFGNYIITTDVGGAKDITNNGEIGVVTEIENEEQYKKEILKVINEEINLKEKYNQSLKWSEEKFLWNNIVKYEKIRRFFS